jgi:hypothetical protein
LNGSHWHNCRLVLGLGQLRIRAEHYVTDGRAPAGQCVAVLPIRLPGDPHRAGQLDALVRDTWRQSADGYLRPPTNVVATCDRVTITSESSVIDLRAEGLAAYGGVTGFRGRLDWIAPSPWDSDEGRFLVRIDLARLSRPPRHRSLLLTVDAGLAAVHLPEAGTPVVGSHYASGHVAIAGATSNPDAPWLAGRLIGPPDVIPLTRGPKRTGAPPPSPGSAKPAETGRQRHRPTEQQAVDEEPF